MSRKFSRASITLTVGPIASGKSSYCRRKAKEDNSLIVNQDVLLSMLHGNYAYVAELRGLYNKIEDSIVLTGLAAGQSIIIDRPHLTKEARARWIELGGRLSVPVFAAIFQFVAPEIHAKRRFLFDARGQKPDEWLRVARQQAQQWADEPLEIDEEGFAGLIQPEL